jgi:hypothetical protein
MTQISLDRPVASRDPTKKKNLFGSDYGGNIGTVDRPVAWTSRLGRNSISTSILGGICGLAAKFSVFQTFN